MADLYKPSRRHQIVCEGDGDEAFLLKLLARYDISDFEISTPRGEDGRSIGVNGFKTHIKALRLFIDRGEISGLIVVADNDVRPHRSFIAARREIKRAGGNLPLPDRPLQMKHGHQVSTAILMLPGTDQPGNLETLLLRSADRLRPDLKTCVDTYCECTGSAAWPITMRDKMRLRAMIAATYKDNPNCSLSWVWGSDVGLLDIGDPAFTPVVEFLRAFVARTA